MEAKVFLLLSLCGVFGLSVSQIDIPEGDGDGPGGIIVLTSFGLVPTPTPVLDPEPEPTPEPDPDPEPTPEPDPDPEPTPDPDPPSEEPCPDLDDCNLVCAFGYREDPESGCPVCECIQGPDDDEDSSDGDSSDDSSESSDSTDDSTQDSDDSTQDSDDSTQDSDDSTQDSDDSTQDSDDSTQDSDDSTQDSDDSTQDSDDSTQDSDDSTQDSDDSTQDSDDSTQDSDDSIQDSDDSTQDSDDSIQDSDDSTQDSDDSTQDSDDSTQDSDDSVSDSTTGEVTNSTIETEENDETTKVTDSMDGEDTTQGSDDMTSDTSHPEIDSTETTSGSNDTTVSVSRTGDTTVSDSRTGETTVSDSRTGETTVSDSRTGETTVSDSKTGETTVSDSRTGDTTVSDSRTGETTVSDSRTGATIEASNSSVTQGSSDTEMTRYNDDTTDDTSEATDTNGITHDSDTYDSSETSLDSSDNSDSSDSSDSTDSSETTIFFISGNRCPTVRGLIDEGCRLSCIVLNEITGCPACNHTCVKSGADEECESDEDCGDNAICLAVGRFGALACVDLLAEGEHCAGGGYYDSEDGSSQDEDSTGGRRDRGRGLGRVNGGLARYSVGHIQFARIPCRDGLVCSSVSVDKKVCTRVNETGTCTLASAEGAAVECDENGDYESTQCEQLESGLFMCQCVEQDGTPVPDTQVTVASVDDAPDCDDIVFGRCEFVGIGGVPVSVRHGDTYLSPDSCTRCLCRAGEGVFCEPAGDCTSFARSTSCFQDGEEYANGETFEDGCNTCGCRNGRVLCTRIRCEEEEDEEEDACDRCRRLPRRPVCANGRTFHSECFATACNGIDALILLPGPCQRYDVCTDLYPCAKGEVCVRRGGAACFTHGGCEPEDLRICVRPEELICEDEEEEDNGNGEGDIPENNGDPEVPLDEEQDDDDFVCGTNGVTYRSLCQLLQDTEKEQAAYGGRCDDEECSGGPVCGTDGITYDNVCLLKSLSANARVDYRGVCEPDGGDSPDGLCVRVSRARRCAYNSSNCRRRVRPEEGCCAVCGGIVYVRIDFDDLDKFVRINPQGRTLDALVVALVESGLFPEEVSDRCSIEPSPTNSGDLGIALVSKDEDNDAEFCNLNSVALADKLNSLSSLDAVPEVAQFINAARAVPVIMEEEETVEYPSGAGCLMPSLLALAVCAIPVLFM